MNETQEAKTNDLHHWIPHFAYGEFHCLWSMLMPKGLDHESQAKEGKEMRRIRRFMLQHSRSLYSIHAWSISHCM